MGGPDSSGRKRKDSKPKLNIADVINHAAMQGKKAKLTTVSIVSDELPVAKNVASAQASSISAKQQALLEKNKAMYVYFFSDVM